MRNSDLIGEDDGGFRVKHPKKAQEIAEAIIPLDLEMPVQALIKPTVVGHRRTYFNNWSVGETESCGTSVCFRACCTNTALISSLLVTIRAVLS